MRGWQSYEALEPFGEARMDYRFCVLAAVLANTVRDSEKKPEPFGPSDFAGHFGMDEQGRPLGAVNGDDEETDEADEDEPSDRELAEAATARFKFRAWAEAVSARFNANKPKPDATPPQTT